MKLQELWNLILTKSGQFLIAENVELDINKFKALVEGCLKIYSLYHPKREVLSIILIDNKYTFSNPPLSVTDVIPLRNSYPSFLTFTQSEPFIVEWEYRKPTLYTNFSGSAEIECLYEWNLLQDGSDYIIPIQDYLFVELVLSQFLIGLGRSRRAFTLNELPITTDASSLVSEGEALYESVIRTLQERSILI